jgi:hypothetical protein
VPETWEEMSVPSSLISTLDNKAFLQVEQEIVDRAKVSKKLWIFCSEQQLSILKGT